MRFNRILQMVRAVQAADNSQIDACRRWPTRVPCLLHHRLAAWMQHAPLLGSPVPMHLGNLMV